MCRGGVGGGSFLDGMEIMFTSAMVGVGAVAIVVGVSLYCDAAVAIGVLSWHIASKGLKSCCCCFGCGGDLMMTVPCGICGGDLMMRVPCEVCCCMFWSGCRSGGALIGACPW